MKRIGEMQEEENRQRFYYKRCRRCGFTVREFVFNIELDRLLALQVSDWDRARNWIDRIQREAKDDTADIAA